MGCAGHKSDLVMAGPLLPVVLKWADGEYSFSLGIDEWQEIARKLFKRFTEQLGVPPELALLAITPPEIYRRISSTRPIPGEMGEVLLQALIGGGMKPQEAMALRKRYHDNRPFLENLQLLQGILLHQMFGPPEADTGKKAEAEETPSSPSADSTQTVQPLASARRKSAK